MCEYKEMAKYYDLFYSNKSYDKDVCFLKILIGNRKTILDVGCGTGIHMNLLEKYGYQVDGLDLSKEMLAIAKTRTKGSLFEGNLIDFKTDKAYDAIISIFAVFNHLKNYKELEKGVLNLYQKLNEKCILIIDLHNGRTNGKKEDNYKDYRRIMTWTFDENFFKEHTEIKYIINNKIYYDTHDFLIYQINKIREVLNKHGFKYYIYENYSNNIASDKSKNIQILIEKE